MVKKVLSALAIYLAVIWFVYDGYVDVQPPARELASTYPPQPAPEPQHIKLTGSMFRRTRAETLNDPDFDFYGTDDLP